MGRGGRGLGAAGSPRGIGNTVTKMGSGGRRRRGNAPEQC